MKPNLFFLAFESILFAILLFFAAVNQEYGTVSQFVFNLKGNVVQISTMYLILAFYVFGIFTGLVYSVIVASRYKAQLEFYARKNEKLSQQNEIDSDDREALQRKIASLEIALDNALKNKG